MKKIISFCLLVNIFFSNIVCFAYEPLKARQKHPCYHEIFLNEDKYEKFNRKVFDINLKLNRIFVKYIHIVWSSILPNFVIDGLNRAYSNVEYPKKIVSCLLQRDFDAIKHETKRFIINTTVGIVGFYDAAERFFNLEKYNEDMEQAFAKCKFKCGNYLVLPFISSVTSRDITGRIFDFLLNPTTYIATPVIALVKMGLLVNRTAFIQPIIKMVESNFADPYDIARKFYAVDKYIKLSNYDRQNVISKIKETYTKNDIEENKTLENLQVKGQIKKSENLILNEIPEYELNADIFLNDYNPQSPITDSMRTALFDENKKTFWAQNSIWNRNFVKKIKTAFIEISPNRDKYKIRYLLNKNKTAPLAILIPSVGEGVNNSHSNVLAEFLYKEGYSILIIGNHFQWEFLKSVEKGHKLGLINEDIKYVDKLINNSIKYLSQKYDRVFLKRIAIGTSLGAYCALYLANEQYQNRANNIDKFIAICPPSELTYAIEKMDEIIDAWNKYPDDLKEKISITTAKVMHAYKNKDKMDKKSLTLPFSDYEAKLISAFVFHQKLSDLIYVTETQNNENIDKKKLYQTIYNSNYTDYIVKYLTKNYSIDEIKNISSLKSISDYLINNDNYKIFHSLDDYLINKAQLKELKSYSDDKLVLLSNGAHLGFLYRDEFLEALKKEIKL